MDITIGAEEIAEHFGCDVEEVEDLRVSGKLWDGRTGDRGQWFFHLESVVWCEALDMEGRPLGNPYLVGIPGG